MRYLGMPECSPAEWLGELQKSKYLGLQTDTYNVGEAVQLLERRAAELLGKPKALFFPKGMTAQYVTLKVAEQKANNSHFALHPLSHIAFDESAAYKHLLNLQAHFVGDNRTPFKVENLKQMQQQVASVVVELPLRRAGFRLPTWQGLLEISEYCRSQDIHCHMDGARLWESTVYYHKSEAEIAQLFDSVYVSMYKGLGGLGGAILAGEQDFIEECKVWRSRFAGDHFTSFPQIISALDGLDSKHSHIPELVARAKEVAECLSNIEGLSVLEPQTNGFLVFLSGDVEHLNRRADELNQTMGMKLFRAVDVYPNSQDSMVELQIGHQHQQISTNEIKRYFESLLSAAA